VATPFAPTQETEVNIEIQRCDEVFIEEDPPLVDVTYLAGSQEIYDISSIVSKGPVADFCGPVSCVSLHSSWPMDSATKTITFKPTPSQAGTHIVKLECGMQDYPLLPIETFDFLVVIEEPCYVERYAADPSASLPATAYYARSQVLQLVLAFNFFIQPPECEYNRVRTYFVNDVETAVASLPAWLVIDEALEEFTVDTDDSSDNGTYLIRVDSFLNIQGDYSAS